MFDMLCHCVGVHAMMADGTHQENVSVESCSRRRFVELAGCVLGGASLGGLLLSCREHEKATARWGGFKYAMCNESMPGLSWAEQCRIVSGAGYRGIEVAAFTLVKEGVQEIGPTKRKEMVSDMQRAGLECVGLHWLLAPPPKGLHITSPDAAVRKKSVAYLNELIDFCADISGPRMIFGSPKQRHTQGISVEQAKTYFAEGLSAVADHAEKRRVEILIEALAKGATDVVNTMAEASELASRVNPPAIQIMFDFNNTGDETEPFDVLIRKYYQHIGHVHVQEQGGKYLGTGNAVNDYVKAFQTLKDLKYDKWISLEVFDFSPGGKRIAEESMSTLRQIEAKLV